MKIHSHSILLSGGESVSGEFFVPQNPKALFVFAHGAGTNMHHSFMKELSGELANHQIATLRYNFLYSEQKKKRPDFPAVAHKAVAAAIQKANESFPNIPLFAGGKSFGGRMTSQYVSEKVNETLSGLVFVGFPLHPAGKPGVERATHLDKIKIPILFLQGSRDALAEWPLMEQTSKKLTTSSLIKFEGADHSFKAGKQNLIPTLANEIKIWINGVLKK